MFSLVQSDDEAQEAEQTWPDAHTITPSWNALPLAVIPVQGTDAGQMNWANLHAMYPSHAHLLPGPNRTTDLSVVDKPRGWKEK